MHNPMELKDKTILVTGASSGIGRATSILLSQLGAHVVLAGRNIETLTETKSLMEGTHHTMGVIDLSQTDSIPMWMKELVTTTGPLDGAVHCAGSHVAKPLRMVTTETMSQIMELNLYAAVGVAKGFRQKTVIGKNGGSLVFLSSVVGLVGQAGIMPYAASKGAIIAITKSLAVELAAEKIRVNCVVPAVVNTAMSKKLLGMMLPEQVKAIEAQHPLGLGEPLDIANAIAFLLSSASRWITGSHLVVDGGYTAI